MGGRVIQRETIEEAFWQYVRKVEGCWRWAASLGNHGYGQLTYRQQKYTAHRLSWEFHFGPIPDGLCVLHKCDNRQCVNPEHLFLGTRADNLVDMTRKGRRVKGDAHGRRILCEAQVVEILRSSETQKVLAVRYGVSTGAISSIKRRENWKHVQVQ